MQNSVVDPNPDGVLTRSEAQIVAAFAQAPVAFALLSGPDLIYTAVNKLYEELIGRKDLIGRKFAEARSELKNSGVFAILDEVFATGERYVAKERKTRVTYEDLRPPQDLYLNFTIEPSRSENGLVTGLLITAVDITDQVVARELIQNGNEEFRTLRHSAEIERHKFESVFADAATPMALTRGPLHIYEHANRSYAALFNNRVLIGKPLLDALPELRGQSFPDHFEKTFHTGVPYVDNEALAYLRRTADGPLEERYFDQTYTQLLDVDGKPWGVFIHAFEVTERVFAKRMLQESEAQLTLANEAAKLGTWVLNTVTNKFAWSPRAAEIYGMPYQSEVDVAEIRKRFSPEDQHLLDTDVQTLMDVDGPLGVEREHRIIWPDGSIHWVQASSKATVSVINGQRIVNRIVGTLLDFTDRVAVEVELKNAKETAEQASAAKSAFLANMSHEIRTPLGAIMGFVGLIKDENIPRRELDDHLTVIDRNSNQLLRIIDDILDLSKVEAGMMLIEHIEFSLVELLSDFASLMGFRARHRGIQFELKAQTELPETINSDPTRIRQILTNIVGNAIKFTEVGRVELTVSYNGGFVEFEVLDTGRGVTKDEEAGLFQPFTQADVSITRKFGGTGLGLVLTRRLSEALGGTFVLKSSQVGRGSVFVSRIRVEVANDVKMVRALGYETHATTSISPIGKLGGLRVLLVEDSPDNQALISILLRRAGATIDIVSNGRAGVDAALASSYDVVLMDVQMPVLDGISAVKELRSQNYRGPIVALTAHAMKEEQTRCLNAGFSEFLSKPIQRDKLFTTLGQYIPEFGESLTD